MQSHRLSWRRIDRIVSAVLAVGLFAATTVLWLAGADARSAASAYASAPACGGAPASGCRAGVSAPVTAEGVSSDGHFQLSLGAPLNSTVNLEAGSGALAPAPGTTVTAQVWQGSVTEVDTPAGSYSTLADPGVAAASNLELVLVLLVAALVTGAVALFPLFTSALRRVRHDEPRAKDGVPATVPGASDKGAATPIAAAATPATAPPGSGVAIAFDPPGTGTALAPPAGGQGKPLNPTGTPLNPTGTPLNPTGTALNPTGVALNPPPAPPATTDDGSPVELEPDPVSQTGSS